MLYYEAPPGMEVFPYRFRLFGQDRFVLWVQDDVDVVLKTDAGRIATFDTVEKAQQFAAQRNVTITMPDGDPSLQLDWIADGGSFVTGDIDCIETISAWNLFADIAATFPEQSAHFRSVDRRPHTIYDKVFWGNNLPAVTPEGERYEPA